MKRILGLLICGVVVFSGCKNNDDASVKAVANSSSLPTGNKTTSTESLAYANFSVTDCPKYLKEALQLYNDQTIDKSTYLLSPYEINCLVPWLRFDVEAFRASDSGNDFFRGEHSANPAVFNNILASMAIALRKGSGNGAIKEGTYNADTNSGCQSLQVKVFANNQDRRVEASCSWGATFNYIFNNCSKSTCPDSLGTTTLTVYEGDRIGLKPNGNTEVTFSRPDPSLVGKCSNGGFPADGSCWYYTATSGTKCGDYCKTSLAMIYDPATCQAGSQTCGAVAKKFNLTIGTLGAGNFCTASTRNSTPSLSYAQVSNCETYSQSYVAPICACK